MILLALLGCNALDLSQEWQLDRLRLLAIRAEPAEPAPGDTVTFTSLSYIPGNVDWSAIWFACVTGGSSGCTFDPALLDGFEDIESLTPEEQAALFASLQAAGFAGVEPGMTPTWYVPVDALDGLTDAERLEGLSATVQVTLATDDDTELVLKNVPVSEATTPNTNPDIASVTVDGDPVSAGFLAKREQSYELVATAAGLEDYTYVTTDGVTETRTEELEWRWYAEAGELAGAFDISDSEPESDTITWLAPAEAGAYLMHTVVLDGRGGMGWTTLTVTVE